MATIGLTLTTYNRVTMDDYEGEVVIGGVDSQEVISNIIRQSSVEHVLSCINYDEIVQYVTDCENDKKELAEAEKGEY